MRNHWGRIKIGFLGEDLGEMGVEGVGLTKRVFGNVYRTQRHRLLLKPNLTFPNLSIATPTPPVGQALAVLPGEAAAQQQVLNAVFVGGAALPVLGERLLFEFSA